MAARNGCIFNTQSAKFAPSLLNYFSTFQVESTIFKNSGTVGSSATYGTTQSYVKPDGKSIYSYNDSTSTPLVWNLGSAMEKTVQKTGSYWVIVLIMQEQNSIQYFPHTFRIDISQNGVSADDDHKILCKLPEEDVDGFQMEPFQWYYFAQLIDLDANDLINFQFTHTTHPSTVVGFSKLHIGAVGLVYNDRLLEFPPMYQPPSNIMSENVVLDFPNTAPGAFSDLTATFNGAIDLDVVEVGVSFSITALGGEYSAFVSASNQVTVRFKNDTGSDINPPSGTFKLSINK